MKTELSRNRRIPLAIVAVILLQAGTAIWWAAEKDAGDRFESQRVTNLEQLAQKSADQNAETLSRLARIEERMNGEAAALDRIEKQIGSRH